MLYVVKCNFSTGNFSVYIIHVEGTNKLYKKTHTHTCTGYTYTPNNPLS